MSFLEQLKSPDKIWLLITVIMIEVLAGAEADIFVPSFPELQRLFNLSDYWTQMLLSVNFVSYCFFSLITGYLGDRYGNRYTILIGLVFFIIGSGLCIWAPTFYTLLFGRFIQGMGIAGPAVLAYVLVSNSFSVTLQQRIFGILNSIATLGMAAAPVAGSYIILFFGWRASFILLLFTGLICLYLSWSYVPKKNPRQQHKIEEKQESYLTLLTSYKMNMYLIPGILIVIPFWVFIGLSPLFYMANLGVTLHEFGFYQGSLTAIYSIISLLTPKILDKFGNKKPFNWGMVGLFLSSLFLFLAAFLNTRSPLLITAIMGFLSISICIPITIYYPQFLEIFPNAKGRASALFLAGRLLLAALLMEFISYYYEGQFLIFGLVLSVTLFIGSLGILFLQKRRWMKV